MRRRIAESLDALAALAEVAAGPLKLLSLCAGDGRDVIPVLAAHPRGTDITAVLVEANDELAVAAATAAADAGLAGVEIRRGDAGDPSVFADLLPVHLLLLCGIFGNIAEADIEATVAAVPALLVPGGLVVWTRGSGGGAAPDLRPRVRRWFTQHGLTEISFDGAPEPFGVGLNVLTDPADAPSSLPSRLFTFTR